VKKEKLDSRPFINFTTDICPTQAYARIDVIAHSQVFTSQQQGKTPATK
jgi:hypothetical protein